MDYAGIRIWHAWSSTLGHYWRELQKRAARESAPIDALFLDAQEQWVAARDFAPDHPIHAALALDHERRRRGFGEPCGPEKDA
jgi:hypothetical protein